MIWFTWRQFRTQTWITVAGLAVLAAALAVTAVSIADAYAAAGLDACTGDCATAVETFLRDVRAGVPGTTYPVASALMYVLPVMIGMFWGAPLLARELETGTHRLAWNQSVTRTRWLATKLILIGGGAVAATGLLSWAVTGWASRIDELTGDRITPSLFGARGIVPIGYAAFAFILGVTAGMLIRRTVPAMAATLAVYAAAVAAMPLWIRARLVPADQATPALDMSALDMLGIMPDNSMQVLGEGPSDAWVLSNRTITASGDLFTGPAEPRYCGPEAPPRGCDEWVGSLGLRQDLSYHPDSHFWPLQLAETGVFLGIAALLTGFCFWWLRRRLS